MEKFKRSFYQAKGDRQRAIEKLKIMPWFEFLKNDIECGEAFPALRYNREIDFYYRGALLCKYVGNLKGEPTASRNKKLLNPHNQDDYEEIKSGCEEWGKKTSGKDNERATLSVLSCKFSPYINPSPRMVLLDIEIGFPKLCLSDEEDYRNTQVDLLFLDKDTGMLYFVEAKGAADSRIKKEYTGQSDSELYDSLEIAEQLNKYNANLEQREDEILIAYSDYLDIMREIFGCKIYAGKLALYPRTKLLVYGKSTDNGIKSLGAIRAKLGDDLIVFEAGLDEVNNLPEKITAGSLRE